MMNLYQNCTWTSKSWETHIKSEMMETKQKNMLSRLAHVRHKLTEKEKNRDPRPFCSFVLFGHSNTFWYSDKYSGLKIHDSMLISITTRFNYYCERFGKYHLSSFLLTP